MKKKSKVEKEYRRGFYEGASWIHLRIGLLLNEELKRIRDEDEKEK